MKSIILLAIYLLSFVVIYMMLSLVFLVFRNISYLDVLHHEIWSVMYCVIFWWIAIFPTKEYYIAHKEHFEKLF